MHSARRLVGRDSADLRNHPRPMSGRGVRSECSAEYQPTIATVPGLDPTPRSAWARPSTSFARARDFGGGSERLRPADPLQKDLFDRCSEMRSNACQPIANSVPGPNSLGLSLSGRTRLSCSALTPGRGHQPRHDQRRARSFSGTIGARLAAVRAGRYRRPRQRPPARRGRPHPGPVGDWSELLGDASNGAGLSRLGVFVNGHGSFGSRDDSDREPGFDFHDGGVTLGADYRFTDAFIGGLAFTFVGGHAEFNAGLGDTDSRSYGLTAYATYSPGRFYIDGAVGFAWNTYDTNRRIRIPPATCGGHRMSGAGKGTPAQCRLWWTAPRRAIPTATSSPSTSAWGTTSRSARSRSRRPSGSRRSTWRSTGIAKTARPVSICRSRSRTSSPFRARWAGASRTRSARGSGCSCHRSRASGVMSSKTIAATSRRGTSTT